MKIGAGDDYPVIPHPHTTAPKVGTFVGKDHMIDFVVWYSGMTRDKVKRAYARYLRETNQQPS